ncbi:MAG: glycosyltransferase family 4 protein [Solirubrobacterales bacterium]|nr:glycosyltransferase family 4 protein [Solirubrobacterales bacterium]MBV9365009.1 glycosyltransferase family 4 protein [Solirubrobacterales bacterium]MBV9810162.1 glycosyltransferase family 4 protein [Solirubrobacterales bacterium]
MILILHNRYRAAGGEERAVGDLAALLRRRGHEVEVLERSSGGLTRGAAAHGLLVGGVDPDEVAALVRRRGARVVHAHNIHPLFGWRALAAARAAGARTLLHLHNYRLFCAIGIAYRDGAPCFRCRRRHTLPGLRLRCRGSVPEAAVYAAALYRQQPRLLEHVDQFVAVSGALASQLRDLGLPASLTATLPNFVPDDEVAGESHAGAGEFALVAGRLAEEKGFDTAIAAARATGTPLVVAGAGPDEPRLRSLAAGADVRFTGRLAPDALSRLRARAAVVLAPSRWEEPFPYSVLEALGAGVPVLASDRGGLPELVGEDAVLPARDQAVWSNALSELWHDPPLRAARGEQALARARAQFSEAGYYDRLGQLYGAVSP